MNRSLRKELFREIRGSFTRFLSIFIMVALGTLFMVGLRSAAPDMRNTADEYFDDKGFMDIQILSTLGLTEEDIQAFSQVEGVEKAEGGWSLDGLLTQEDSEQVVKAISLSDEGFNTPTLMAGTLPTAEDECAVEEKLLNTYGVELGDTVTLTLGEGMEDALKTNTFTVTGVVESPLYISIDRGTSSLGDGSVDAYLLLPEASFELDYYTVCNVMAEGAAELDAYSEEYQNRIDALTDRLTEAAEERADLRYETLVSDAQVQVDDAQAELDAARSEADQEIADGQAELDDARSELDDGWAELSQAKEDYAQGVQDGQTELDDARAELDQGWADLSQARDSLNAAQSTLDAQRASAQVQLAAAEQELLDNQALLEEKAAELSAAAEAIAALEQQIAEYADGLEQQNQAVEEAEKLGIPIDPSSLPLNQETLDQMNAALAEAQAQLVQGEAALQEGQAQLEAGRTQLETQKVLAEAQLASAQAQINTGWGDYYDGKAELEQGEADYAQGVIDYQTEIADAAQEIADGEQELLDGEADYAQGLQDLEEAKTEADSQLADGQAEIDEARDTIGEIQPADVYVLDRNSNYGFVSYDQNAERMENLANMFPLIFFVVAALVCLTTMTRMVEEQRTEIGSIKAMGYGTGTIAWKFILYGALAALGGGVVGVAIGSTAIPWVIFTSYGILYNLPELHLSLYWPLSIGAVAAGLICTVGATLWAMLSTARETPAALMRPKAPKAGKRIFLEHLPFIWKHLNFSIKVSCRNLFRYKKRFFMTVIGIAGCTALMIAGLGLRTSIFSIIEIQYGELYTYSLQVTLDTERDEEIDSVRTYLETSNNVASFAEAYTRAVTVSGSSTADAYVIVTDDPEALSQQIKLRDMKEKTRLDIPEDGVLIDEKLAELMDVAVGDEITVECGTKAQVRVAGILEHYVRHYVYMSAEQYESLYGETYTPNELIVTALDGSDEALSRMSEELMAMKGVSAATNVVASGKAFEDSLQVVNAAVTIIILAAAALALVVLYNLTNINITERIRELATIKVLGFYDGEVAMYVYRENIILTFLGIALGQVLGKFLCGYLVRTIEMDIVMFGRQAQTQDYIWSVVLSLVFAMIVNILMFFRMQKIDMVQSLKSVE